MRTRHILFTLLACATSSHAVPILTSWYTENSGVLARVIQGGGPAPTTPTTSWPTRNVTLTGCTTNGTTTVTCANTAGLVAGMSITGTTIKPNTTISSVSTLNTTTFTLSQTSQAGQSGLSLTAADVQNSNTNGAAQSVPAYADVQRIRYTSTDVYINASGFASYTMGPWYGSAAQTSPWGFWPLAQNYSTRITRTPVVKSLPKTKHPGGMIGMMVNGVAIYDLGDAFSFKQTANSPSVTGSDTAPPTAGDGFWSRDALAVEVVTFDPGFAHQPGSNGQYHYHAEPKALRYQLGDNMTATFNPTTSPPVTGNTYTYTETDVNGTVTTPHHSPILGWSFDGYPIYGPYGYSSAMDASSVVRRMKSGFVLRNVANGTANITSTGRTTLPKWAVAAQSYTGSTTNGIGDYVLAAAEYGPATTYQTTAPNGTTTYSLGRYIGDYDYLGDRGKTQGVDFDLEQYNGRQCVTPEFPVSPGTYAYFVSIDASGNPAFPYMLGKQFYSVQNGANNATVPGTATELLKGGLNIMETWKGGLAVDPASGNVTLTWNSVEGGTYTVQATNDFSAWTTLSSTVQGPVNTVVPAPASVITTTAVIEAKASMPANTTRRFCKVIRNP